MKLIESMKNRGLSAIDLAAALKCTRQTVHNYITGRTRPNRTIMRKLREVLEGEVLPNDFE